MEGIGLWIIERRHPDLTADVFRQFVMGEPEGRHFECFFSQPVGQTRVLDLSAIKMTLAFARKKADDVHHPFLVRELPEHVEPPKPSPFLLALLAVEIVIKAPRLLVEVCEILFPVLLLVEQWDEPSALVDAEQPVRVDRPVEVGVLRKEIPVSFLTKLLDPVLGFRLLQSGRPTDSNLLE